MQEYFAKFGDIASARLCHGTDYIYGFVQFVNPEHAANVLSKRQYKIYGAVVRVKEADSRHQPRIPYDPIESQSDILIASNIPIPDLNDDCLRDIFDYATALDLISLAKVNSRFQRIAQERFAVKYKKFRLASLSDEAGKNNTILRMEQLVNFLTHFGSLIVSLEVDRSGSIDGKYMTLELIAAHCTGTLHELTLNGFDMKGRQQHLRSLLAKLRKLYLVGCEFSKEFSKILRGCSALTKLKISDTFDMPNMIFNLPALESISFENIECPKKFLRRFLQKNPQLRKVKIIRCGDVDSAVFPAIASFVPQMEKISFKQNDSYGECSFVQNAKHFTKLVALKKLAIHCSGFPMHSVFNEMVSANIALEYLDIQRCPGGHELYDAISSMKTLKTLKMRKVNKLSSSNVLSICENLPELSEILMDCGDLSADTLIKVVQKTPKLQAIELMRSSVAIDANSFETILRIVRNRPVPLEIVLCAGYDPITVSNELRKANKHSLNLVTKVYESEDDELTDESDESHEWDSDEDYENYDYVDSDGDFVFGYDSDDDDEVGLNRRAHRIYMDCLVGMIEMIGHHV